MCGVEKSENRRGCNHVCIGVLQVEFNKGDMGCECVWAFPRRSQGAYDVSLTLMYTVVYFKFALRVCDGGWRVLLTPPPSAVDGSTPKRICLATNRISNVQMCRQGEKSGDDGDVLIVNQTLSFGTNFSGRPWICPEILSSFVLKSSRHFFFVNVKMIQ